ncbi:MAG: hypothetical protein PHR35_03650, partial [Kiritimatiellae bacterium]|nr:hypothetical protein [Kiritimatiellia bacterium]
MSKSRILTRRAGALCLAFCLAGVGSLHTHAEGSVAEPPIPIPTINDAAILATMEPVELTNLPPRLATPEALAGVHAGRSTLLTAYPSMFGNPTLGRRMAETIPE